MKRVIMLGLMVLLALPVMGSAKDMTGKYGLGYFNTDAPVGARFWVAPKVGIDVGVGFKMEDVYVGAQPEKQTASSFWIEAGVPFVIFPSERANFFVRPGVVLGLLDDRSYGTGNLDSKWTLLSFSLTPGAEIFFGDHFSLEAGHGIALDMLMVPDEDGIPTYRRGETETTVRSFDASVTYLGFHFYFK